MHFHASKIDSKIWVQNKVDRKQTPIIEIFHDVTDGLQLIDRHTFT